MSSPLFSWQEPIFWISREVTATSISSVAEHVPHSKVRLKEIWAYCRSVKNQVLFALALTIVFGAGLLLAERGTFWHKLSVALFIVGAVRGLFAFVLSIFGMAVSRSSVPNGQIQIRSKEIVRVVEGEDVDKWPKDEIRRIQLRRVKHTQGERSIMRIKTKDRRWHEIAVAPGVSLSKLEAVLKREGLNAGISTKLYPTFRM